MKSRVTSSVLAIGLLLVASAATAQVYRWTDAQGRIQMSDRKPPEGTPNVQVIDTKQYAVDPKAHADAVRRAAEDRDRLKEMEQRRQQAMAPAAPASGASAPAAGASGPVAAASKPKGPPGETDCARRQREFRESQECFAPFRQANGSLRPEAMEKCGPATAQPPSC